MIDMAVLLLALFVDEDPARHAPVEAAALKARREIQSGHVTLQYFHRSGSDFPISTVYEFYFDGERRFLKKEDQGAQEAYPPSVVPSTTRTIKTPSALMSHRVDNDYQGRRFAAFVDDRAQIEALVLNQPGLKEHVELESELVFDPRLIGMVPFSIGRFYKKSLDSHLCGPRTTAARVRNVAQLAHLRLTRSENEQLEAWVDEARGFVPVRMELTTVNTEDGSLLIETMEADLKQFTDGSGMRWFPSHLRFTLRNGVGGVITVLEREEILVLSAEFNIPVPERQFTLEALELPENTLIIHRPDAALNAVSPAGSPPGSSRLRKWHENQATPLTKEDFKLRRLSLSPSPEQTASQQHGPLSLGRLALWNLVGLGTGLVIVAVCRVVSRLKSGGKP